MTFVSQLTWSVGGRQEHGVYSVQRAGDRPAVGKIADGELGCAAETRSRFRFIADERPDLFPFRCQLGDGGRADIPRCSRDQNQDSPFPPRAFVARTTHALDANRTPSDVS